MHKDSMDVAFRVTHVRPASSVGITYVTGDWWNLGYEGNPWCIDHTSSDVIPVFTECLKDWTDITDTMTRKRTKSGLP